MSLLLAGPSSITPWIEDAVFQALVHGPADELQRPRLAQVLAMRRYGPETTTTTTPTNNSGCCTTCPSFLVVHDGKTSVVCFLNKPIPPSKHAGLPTKGCIVRIANYKVSLVESCVAGPHGQHLQAHPPDAVSYYLDVVKQSPRLCLDVANVEALGGHGIGIVGNPIHVHQSVDVRRALLSLDSKNKSLAQQLKLLSMPLGNVQQLFSSAGGASSPSPLIQSLIAMAKEHDRKPTASTTTTSPSSGVVVVVLGNVQDLLDQSSKHDPKDNSFNRLLSLAKKQQPLVVVQQQSQPRTGAPGAPPARCVLGDVKALLSGNTQGGVTLNDVLQLARQMDSTTTPSSKDLAGGVVMEPYEISAANVVSRKSMVSLSGMQSILNNASEHETQQQATAGGVTEESPLQDEQGQRMEPYKITNALVVPRKNMVSLSGKTPSMNMEPYKIRENVARHDSIVSVSSGIQSALTSALLGRTSFISEVDTREAEQTPPPVTMETTKDVTNEDDDNNDSDNSSSDIAGISDMLISQTQDEGDTCEQQMQSKKRSLVGATTTNEESSVVDDAPPQKKTKAATAKKRRSMSLLQHVMSQACKGSRTKTSTAALQKQGPAKMKHNGMLSSWLAQRVRPKRR